MTIELMINRLIGQAESGSPAPFSQEESRELSQRLRALVDEEVGEPGSAGVDRGPAAEALQLAAYLDGAMDPTERAAFERELVRSPERRDELLDAAAWLDALAARHEMPPAEATDLVLAMDTPARLPVPTAWWEPAAAFLERIFPRRLAVATSALATLAIAVVGLDLALHLTPMPSTPPVAGTSANQPAREIPPIRTMFPDQPGRVLLTAETINALLAYHQDPSDAARAELLRCLGRAGLPAFPNVSGITLQPRLLERLQRRDGALPSAITASVALDGTLRLESVD